MLISITKLYKKGIGVHSEEKQQSALTIDYRDFFDRIQSWECSMVKLILWNIFNFDMIFNDSLRTVLVPFSIHEYLIEIWNRYGEYVSMGTGDPYKCILWMQNIKCYISSSNIEFFIKELSRWKINNSIRHVCAFTFSFMMSILFLLLELDA